MVYYILLHTLLLRLRLTFINEKKVLSFGRKILQESQPATAVYGYSTYTKYMT